MAPVPQALAPYGIETSKFKQTAGMTLLGDELGGSAAKVQNVAAELGCRNLLILVVLL